MSQPVTLFLALVALVTVVATVAGAQEPTEGPDPGLVAEGRQLYGQHCATCHGTEGRGGRGETARAPAIDDASPALIDFVIRTGRMPLPHIDARSQRRDPVLSDVQRRALVAYARTFGPDEPAVPEPDPAVGDLARGRELFEENCIACHSPFGRGIAVSQRDIAPDLEPASPVEIAEAVRTGPGVMPRFGPEQLPPQAVDDIIRYVRYLTRERATPGGLAIGRSGPVTEGFVAWGVGLVLVVVAAYLLGRHRA